MKRNMYSLIELIIVITVILMIISLLLPCLSNVREQMKRTGCMSNLRQIGQILQAYAGDENGNIPVGEPSYKPQLYYTGIWVDQPEHIGIVYDRMLKEAPSVAYCPGASFLKSDSPYFGSSKWEKTWCRSSYQSRLTQQTLNSKYFQNRSTPAILLDAQYGNGLFSNEDTGVFGKQYCHKLIYSSILYYDGTVQCKSNLDGRFSALTNLELPFVNADAAY